MAPHIQVGTASGHSMTSAGTYDLVILQLPSNFPTTAHVVSGFQVNMLCVDPMCDANCTVTFSKHAVTIYNPTGTPIITDWRETDGPSLWCMSLMPNP